MEDFIYCAVAAVQYLLKHLAIVQTSCQVCLVDVSLGGSKYITIHLICIAK